MGDRVVGGHDSDGEAARDALLSDVVGSFADCEDARLREILTSLTRHLHAFVRDVGLTEREWEAGIDFLTGVGRITDENRQEFVLLSDVLGLSMLTVGINQPSAAGVTESTVFGPFFAHDAPAIEPGGDLAAGAPGTPAWVSGRVIDVHGRPVAGARIDVWEADETGRYDVQYGDDRTTGRGFLLSAQDGGFRFWCVKPSAYPIPHDGPVGQMLRATGRSPMRPAHLHFMVTARGFARLVTHIFVAGSRHLEDDAVFGVKGSLIVPFFDHGPGQAPDGRILDEPWAQAEVDLVLADAE